MSETGIDAETQAAIDREMTASDPAQASGNHSARAAHAGAALKLMTDAWHPVPSANPTDAVGAQRRLDFLDKDAAFGARFLAGDAAAVREHNALREMVL